MKYVLIVTLLLCSMGDTFSQDVFKTELYHMDLIMKYRSEIELSEDQTTTIKEIYNQGMPEFNSLKWDLDYALKELREVLSEDQVDLALAESKMQSLLELEEKLKMLRLQMLVNIKNELSSEQLSKLRELKGDDLYTIDMITPINEDPRVVLKVEGDDSKEKPLYIIIRGGKEERVESVSDLDPDDIDSIEVLKGKAAERTYGKDGKNGVVVIKVKNKSKQ